MKPPSRSPGALCRPALKECVRLAREHLQAAPRRALREQLDLDPECPVVATGHQPEFFHPGIWFRLFLLDRLAREDHLQAVFVVVDTDRARSDALVPCLEAGRVKPHRLWMVPETKEPAERLPVPTAGAWEGFMAQAAGCLRRPLEELWEAGLQALEKAQDYVDFHMRLRRSLEGTSDRRELRLSSLCESAAFRHFVARLEGDAEAFRTAHNKALRRLGRYPVQPLAEGELPFWPTGRPKALALTLFLRLQLCDLFVHGAGGWGYEAVNEMILQDYFQEIGAPVAVATASLGPGLNRRAPTAVERDLRDIDQAPERLLDDPDFRSRKQALLDRLQALPRGRRSALHRQLESLRQKGSSRLAPRRQQLVLELEEAKAAWRRDYAYFVHPARQVRSLAEGLT